MQASGIIHVGEAQGTARAVFGRLRGRSAIYLTLLFGLLALGGIAGGALGAWLGRDDVSPFVAFGMIAGFAVYILAARRVVTRTYRGSFAARGLAMEVPVAFTLTPDGLTCESGDLVQTARWPAVTDLFRAGHYWIFLAMGTPFYLPFRFFPTLDEERAFIAAALGHMTPQARERSEAAVSFARSIKAN